jgi:hypothetical protein
MRINRTRPTAANRGTGQPRNNTKKRSYFTAIMAMIKMAMVRMAQWSALAGVSL